MQHGWADTNAQISSLGRTLASPQAEVVSPNLGYLKTWWRIAPLIEQVEQVAEAYHRRYPETPWRVVGHSMGGLIWLEVLTRHPDWWTHVEKLVLVGSPVGGSDLGRIFDPFKWGLGIARDLGQNRRPLAERLAQEIPMLIVAGNADGGSDGTVPLQCTQFQHAQYVELPGIRHEKLKNHPEVETAIRHFWNNELVASSQVKQAPLLKTLISELQHIPGMTDAHLRDFHRAKVWATFPSGVTLYTWKSPLGVHHVFLADADGTCQFAGFVGWSHAKRLYQFLDAVKANLLSYPSSQ